MGQKYRLYEESTNERVVNEIVEHLQRGAIMIYPTDSAYAMGCALSSIKAINRIKQLKGKKDDNLSLICCTLSNIADYAKVDNQTFRFLKAHTPSPVTFVLQASRGVPNSFLDKKKSVGVRLPNSNIARMIVSALGEPVVSTTIPYRNNEEENISDSSLIYELYGDMVDIFVDGGEIWGELTTVIDLTTNEPSIIREGSYIFDNL